MSMDAAAEFSRAMQQAGLQPPARIIGDGCLHRCAAEGDKGRKLSGWYVFHLDGLAAGAFGDWRSGAHHTWHAKHRGDAMRPEERRRLADAVRSAQRQRDRERAETRRAAQRQAARQWRDAMPANPQHPYLQAKQVGAHGIRQAHGLLLLPMRDEAGELWSVQTINAEGDKRFQRGARKRGLYFAIGTLEAADGVLCIAEGYATAASIFEATGYATACAFDCGNLQSVAEALRRKFPHARIVLCADDDRSTAERIGKNPGIEAATRAAQAVGGLVVTPEHLCPASAGQAMPNDNDTRTTCQR